MAVQQHSVLARFYDILDGFAEGDPVQFLSDDCQLDMMFPGIGDIPNERIAGGKADFTEFLKVLDTRGGTRFQRSGSVRRHNINTLTVVDGVELMVGEGRGGRRNGGLAVVAMAA
jgi:hypothetical protein